MIKRFGAFYVGHLDIDDLGLAGTPVMERRYSREELATTYDRCLQLAQVMERSGFDTLWFAEHHFEPEGYEGIPNITLLSVWLASVTERLRYGAAFNILPNWHPLRLAEDYSMADWITNGRIRLGVGRGYQTREVETLGSPVLDQEANRDLFEEQVEILFKAFNEESFSHHGKHYDIPPAVPFAGEIMKEVTLVPRPMRLPVECFQPIASRNQRGLDFMAKHGIKGFGSPNQDLAQQWLDTLRAHGREDAVLGTDLLMSVGGYIADTHEQAMAETRVYREEVLKRHAAMGFPRGLTDEQIKILSKRETAPSIDIDLDSGRRPDRSSGFTGGPRALMGPPSEMLEQLLQIQEEFPGVEDVNFTPGGESCPLHIMLEQLERFGEEVIRPFLRETGQPIPGEQTTSASSDGAAVARR